MDLAKVKAMFKRECPKTIIKIRSFMGLVDYYRRFIADFFKVVAPLTQLTRKDQPLAWIEKCE